MQGATMVASLLPRDLTPEWLAHRYDPPADAVHFIRADRATRQNVPFLTEENLDASSPAMFRRSDVAGLMRRDVSLRYIFHSAYCCSTLLANVYDRQGKCFSLKEPTILQDIVGWRHRGGQPAQVGAALADAISLLARPFAPGERCVIKPSNVVNGLIPAMMGGRPEAKALLLYAPLRVYLGSIANKGLWGRRWVRDLLTKQLTENFVDLGFTPQDYFLQTDLQVAAVGWLAQHALFTRLAAAMPERVRTLDSELLIADPADTIAALDAFFGINDDDASRAAVISKVFARNSKSGEAFAPDQRHSDQIAARSAHADEIDKVAIWALEVAARADIPPEPGAPLITSIV
jgi:hypothetical protein